MENIMMWAPTILQNVAETFLLICVCHTFLGKPARYAGACYAAIFLGALLYCLVLNSVAIPARLRYLLTFLVFFLYTLGFGGKWLEKLFALLCDFFFNMFLSLVVYWVVDAVAGPAKGLLSLDSLLYALPNITVLTAAGVFILFWGKYKKGQARMSDVQWLMFMLYPGVACVVMLSLLTISRVTDELHELMLLDAFALMVAMIVHFILLHLLNEQNQKAVQAARINQQAQLGQENAQALWDAYNEQRSLIHDFTNQLQTIHGLLDQGQCEAAQNLIDGILPSLYPSVLVINTGNPLVDTILSQKYFQAKKNGIIVFFLLGPLENIPVASSDMVVLVGNLFDNAIEGSQGVDNAEIQIKIQKSEHDFVLSFRNRVCKNIEVTNDKLPLSTKKDAGHGIGLQNVVALFKKNGMDYSITCKDGWFQVSALLYL